MEKYCKPMVVDGMSAHGIIPAIVGLSAAKLLVVGAAAGLALGSSGGHSIYYTLGDSNVLQNEKAIY